MTTEPLLSAHAVGLTYSGVQILRDVHLMLSSGADVALLGRSGSGKTSLLLTLAGLLPLTGGRVERHGLAAGEVGVIFQSPSLLPELSAIENVALPLRLSDTCSVAEARARARDALDEVDVSAFDALPGQLSGGQQQRVAVARVLASRPRVVLADEPTGALDPQSATRVLSALRAHRDHVHGALVVATHD